MPSTILEDTWSYLRERGRRRLEGVAYWTGGASLDGATIHHVMYPAQYERESAVHLVVGRREVFDLIRRVQDLDEFLLARVHSHPEQAFHSWSDDDGCLSGRVGMISIVVSDFARGQPIPQEWAIYERTNGGTWRSWDWAESQRRIRII